MKLQITINIEGDAFARDPWLELHKAFLNVEKKAGEVLVLRREEGSEVELICEVDSPVLDTNGNTVGRVTLTRK